MIKGKLLFFLMVVYTAFVAQESLGAKPRPPVHLIFQQHTLHSEETEIILTARVHTDTASIELLIDLPRNVVLVGGTPAWKGQLQAGESHQIKIRVVSSSGVNPVVEGRAIVHFPNGAAYTQINSLTLEGEIPERSLTPPDNGKRKQRSIFDFRKK